MNTKGIIIGIAVIAALFIGYALWGPSADKQNAETEEITEEAKIIEELDQVDVLEDLDAEFETIDQELEKL